LSQRGRVMLHVTVTQSLKVIRIEHNICFVNYVVIFA